ncbi:23S rRNA (guanosine(2251)-2'-O)-methyltransferase RlmB [Candidatus Marinamargulisbacteria bacterium SCGC AAA071-K20]|nr:23S rRNA (guanosine(2251)-2'-O)-methyltransferase RlmB [Candidatus Marinamargulisbacteria bacterium SCGC AAA071-K20]
MLLKGKHTVLEALKNSPDTLSKIVFCKGIKFQDRVIEIADLAKQFQIQLITLDKRAFEQECDDPNTQNVIAYSQSIAHMDIKELISKKDRFQKVVILDHIEDPFNFGAILRSCAAFGIDAVMYSKHRQSSINAGVIKASSGAVYHIPLVSVSNIAQSLQVLDKAGFWIYGTDVNNGTSLPKFSPNPPYALVIGNEKKGISKTVSKFLHDRINIPMHGNMDSLNVSVATGILLYQLTQAD